MWRHLKIKIPTRLVLCLVQMLVRPVLLVRSLAGCFGGGLFSADHPLLLLITAEIYIMRVRTIEHQSELLTEQSPAAGVVTTELVEKQRPGLSAQQIR